MKLKHFLLKTNLARKNLSEMFDIFLTFPPLDFKESAEFNKNKDQKDIKWFTKPFADIFRVQKWRTSYIGTFIQGAAIAQSLQGFIWWALVCLGNKSPTNSGCLEWVIANDIAPIIANLNTSWYPHQQMLIVLLGQFVYVDLFS